MKSNGPEHWSSVLKRSLHELWPCELSALINLILNSVSGLWVGTLGRDSGMDSGSGLWVGTLGRDSKYKSPCFKCRETFEVWCGACEERWGPADPTCWHTAAAVMAAALTATRWTHSDAELSSRKPNIKDLEFKRVFTLLDALGLRLSIQTCRLSFIFSLLSLSLCSSSSPPPHLSFFLSVPFWYHLCSLHPSHSITFPPSPSSSSLFLPGETACWLRASLRADSWEPLAVIGSCRLSLPVWSVSSSLSKYADVEMKT